MDCINNVIRVAFPTLWNLFVRLNRRVGRTAKLSESSRSKALDRLSESFEAETDLNGAIDDEFDIIEYAASWLFSIPRNDSEYAYLFGLRDDKPDIASNRQTLLMLVADNVRCPSTWWYHDLREALATRRFSKMEDTPYPSVVFRHKQNHGRAQLRPHIADGSTELLPEVEKIWVDKMWEQRDKLGDLDADVLDCLSANWIEQAKDAEDTAYIQIDKILRMRGIRPKISGQGIRGGYRREQRASIVECIEHLENVWFDLLDVTIYPRGPSGRRLRPRSEKLQSRAILVSDRLTQHDLFGDFEIRGIVFKPGTVFSHFLFGSGCQVALFPLKILQYPLAKKFQKRLARYLSWQWRIKARNTDFLEPYRVRTLLKAIDMEIPTRTTSRLKERFEKILYTLEEDGIIGTWQYCRDKLGQTTLGIHAPIQPLFARDDRWLEEQVWIEPPDVISQHYRTTFWEYREKRGRLSPLSEAINQTRIERGFTRLSLCETLQISVSDMMKIESGIAVPERVSAKLERWIVQPRGMTG